MAQYYYNRHWRTAEPPWLWFISPTRRRYVLLIYSWPWDNNPSPIRLRFQNTQGDLFSQDTDTKAKKISLKRTFLHVLTILMLATTPQGFDSAFTYNLFLNLLRFVKLWRSWLMFQDGVLYFTWRKKFIKGACFCQGIYKNPRVFVTPKSNTWKWYLYPNIFR